MDKENMVDTTKLDLQRGKLKIVTWNINGIRSFKKGSLKGVLDSLDADIICLQETKVSRDMVDEATTVVEGYSSYFGFCRKKSGYSGVVTYCKDSITPIKAEEGLTGICIPDGAQEIVGNYGNVSCNRFSNQELRDLDSEGRAVITQHEAKTADGIIVFAVINLYCPRVDPEKPERLEFKLNFFRLLENRVDAIFKTGSKVIVLGDMNISHKTIDHCDPVPEDEFDKDTCKQWLTTFLQDKSIFDMFRYLHPTKTEAYTCWNTKVNARSTNYGTRIDYILADESLAKITASCDILSDILGSDHCPVRAVIEAGPISSNKYPSFCSRYFPEFSGKQTKLTDSFRKRTADNFLTLDSSNEKIERCASENEMKISNDRKRLKLHVKKQASIRNFFTSKSTANDTVIIPVENVNLQTNTEIKDDSPIIPAINSLHETTAKAYAPGLWKSLLSGPRPAPPCKGHNELCVERTVTKKGPNLNRKFWVCARGEGRTNDPKARCNHFAWVPR